MKRMTKKRKMILGIAGGLLVLLLAAGLLVSWEVGHLTAEGILNCNAGVDTRGNSIGQLELWGYDLAAFQSRWPEEALTVTSVDGTAVPVGVYHPDVAPVGAVILIHGFGGDRLCVAPVAEIYLEQGYLVYAMDQRASGESENPLVSFGYFEKQDVTALVDYAKQQSPELPVVVHGQSMGGATAALYGATDHAKDHLDALVLDSAFEAMEPMVLGVMDMDGIVGWYFARCGDWYLKQRYGFVMGDAHVVNKAADIQVPTLVIQCARDDVAPVEIGEAIYEAVDNPDKNYWQANSEHIEAAIDYLEEYTAQVTAFLANTLTA